MSPLPTYAPADPVRRRRYVATVVVAALLLLVAVAGSLLRGGWQTVAAASALRAQGVIYRQDLRLFVVWAEPRPVALRDDGQHLPGDRVLFCESAGWFVGPHGETFDRVGRYADGPASSDLDRVALRVQDGLVQVLPERIIRTPRRSGPGHQPDGPFCAVGDEPLREVSPGFAAVP